MGPEADEKSESRAAWLWVRNWPTFAIVKGDEEAANESGREGGLFCGFVDQLSDTKSHPRAVKSGESSVTTREKSDFVPNEGKGFCT
jgi:hypothetical protein